MFSLGAKNCSRTNLLSQFRRLHLRLHDFERDNLARWLGVDTHLCRVADGESAFPKLSPCDILEPLWFSHDRWRRFGMDGHVDVICVVLSE